MSYNRGNMVLDEFSFQNSPKYLEKIDLEIWNCFRAEKCLFYD